MAVADAVAKNWGDLPKIFEQGVQTRLEADTGAKRGLFKEKGYSLFF